MEKVIAAFLILVAAMGFLALGYRWSIAIKEFIGLLFRKPLKFPTIDSGLIPLKED